MRYIAHTLNNFSNKNKQVRNYYEEDEIISINANGNIVTSI